MNRDDNTFVSCLGMIASFVILLVVSVIMNGWALATIWNWFIPPIFGLTTLTLAKAIGVSMVAELFTGVKSKKSEDTKGKTYTEVLFTALVIEIATPLLTVGIAWIVVQFAF